MGKQLLQLSAASVVQRGKLEVGCVTQVTSAVSWGGLVHLAQPTEPSTPQTVLPSVATWILPLWLRSPGTTLSLNTWKTFLLHSLSHNQISQAGVLHLINAFATSGSTTEVQVRYVFLLTNSWLFPACFPLDYPKVCDLRVIMTRDTFSTIFTCMCMQSFCLCLFLLAKHSCQGGS